MRIKLAANLQEMIKVTTLCFCFSLLVHFASYGVVVHGTVNNSKQRTVAFYRPSTPLSNNSIAIYVSKIDEVGNFLATFDLDSAGPIDVQIGTGIPMRIWISPTDTFTLRIKELWTLVNANGPIVRLRRGSVEFLGHNSEINRFLFEGDIALPNPAIEAAAVSRTFERFSDFIDSIAIALERKSATINQQLTPEQKYYLLGQTKYQMLYCKAMYKSIRAHVLSEADNPNQEFDLDHLWDDWKVLPDIALVSGSYRESLILYFDAMAVRELGAPRTDRDRERLFAAAYRLAIDELTRVPRTREFVTATFLFNMLHFVDALDSAKQLSWDFSKKFPGSTYQKVIDERIKRKTDHISIPKILGTTLNGDTVHISQFKGKLVYIDVWASWCGPCISAFESLPPLIEKTKGKDIMFICLNIDDQDKAWRAVVAKKRLDVLHVRASKEDSKRIRTMLNINSIPRYILIGKNGEILRSNAMPPSQTESELLNYSEK